jgi:hypothetical protein
MAHTPTSSSLYCIITPLPLQRSHIRPALAPPAYPKLSIINRPQGKHARLARAIARARAERSLQSPVRLTPPVLEDDIGESDAANRAESPHRIPDRQYGVAVPIRRQAESSFSFFLE